MNVGDGTDVAGLMGSLSKASAHLEALMDGQG